MFREIISGSRALEKELRVAYLGPAYTYSHLAAIHRFGQSVELVPVGSIQAVFEEVNRRHADFGIVPVENSTDGRVADTLDMFTPVAGEDLRRSADADPSQSAGPLPPRARSKRSTAGRRPCRSAATGWPSTCRRARTIEVTSTTTAAQLAQDKAGRRGHRQRAGRHPLWARTCWRPTSRTRPAT